MGILAGRVALVTGAGAGIGRGIARCFAGAGATVAVAEFNEETGRQVAGELGGLGGAGRFIATDVSRPETVAAAREWAPLGITANIICPGAVTTPFKILMRHNPDMAQEILNTSPMGYMGDPEDDIAPVALFLASDMSRYMTGNTLYVDGGGHINGVPWAPDLDA